VLHNNKEAIVSFLHRDAFKTVRKISQPVCTPGGIDCRHKVLHGLHIFSLWPKPMVASNEDARIKTAFFIFYKFIIKKIISIVNDFIATIYTETDEAPDEDEHAEVGTISSFSLHCMSMVTVNLFEIEKYYLPTIPKRHKTSGFCLPIKGR